MNYCSLISDTKKESAQSVHSRIFKYIKLIWSYFLHFCYVSNRKDWKKKTLGESINLKKQEDWVIGKYKQLDFFSTWLVEEVTPVSWPITERSIVKLDFLWQSNKKIISCTEWLPLVFSNSLWHSLCFCNHFETNFLVNNLEQFHDKCPLVFQKKLDQFNLQHLPW